jgi:ketosteroid isomerase-like protein
LSPEDVVREVFSAFARRDPSVVAALADPDCELWPQGTAERAGRAEPYRGHAGIHEYYEDVAKVWADLRVEPGRLRVARDGVVAFGTACGTTHDGAEHVLPVIWVFKLRAGKVLSLRIAGTAAEATAALGGEGGEGGQAAAPEPAA